MNDLRLQRYIKIIKYPNFFAKIANYSYLCPLMKTIYLSKQSETLSPSVATIGFFDGIHLGHRYLIDWIIEIARSKGLLSTVVTFERHPRQVLQPEWQPEMLSTLAEKIEQFTATGIDQLVVLQFDEAMAALSARDFMHNILFAQLGVRQLVIGYDNHFGHRTPGSTEGFNDYVRYGSEVGMDVVQGTPFMVADIRVSSSKVRRFLSEGDVALAARCLGHPYELAGRVVSGQHVGTGLGFPTANLQPIDADKMVPAPGVYAVRVRMEGALELKHGMMNIGCRPTFGGNSQTLETHIFHFAGDLYGQLVTISFVSRLRTETRFDSREALISQLEADARQAEEILNQTTEI